MIFGTFSMDAVAIHTHRDSYLIAGLSVFSVRRPFLPLALTITLGLGSFGLAFHDLLWLHEQLAIAGLCLASLVGGWTLGQLQLLSRDLRGSELAGAIFGTYGHLNRLRREIIAARCETVQGGET
ncbi:hypothetical protein [Roseibium album]|uniref:Uncharacterized protein n=1 Tax=Roseibium album TaxID=311410 RepID=A0A0M7A8K3_9HYPH|nr:hypothetical protein [Roseibium album]CTQ58145.1 hypothetical protein LA5094_00902 [Roseibium album]CTQ65678.1 hypothetical protein LA5096_00813 [Roseibium album]CTQ70560.1 hypothetical protein LA5095_01957 [Roseibium album]